MRIFYLRNSKGFPEACVATEKQGNSILFGYSSWNSKADKFSKAEGRKTAIERLNNPEERWAIVASKGVKQGIMEFIAKNGDSQRARGAAELWLANHTQKEIKGLFATANDIARSLFMGKFNLVSSNWWDKENSLTSETKMDYTRMATKLLKDFHITKKEN